MEDEYVVVGEEEEEGAEDESIITGMALMRDDSKVRESWARPEREKEKFPLSHLLSPHTED